MQQNIFSISGQQALVTGAGANGGIGHAIALGLARAGVKLYLADIDQEGLNRSINESRDLGGEAEGMRCDIAEENQVQALFDWLDSTGAQLDILVNVPFAFPSRTRPHLLKYADWLKTQQVSVTGYFLCCRAAIERMLPQKRGCIINIGSNAGVSALGRGAMAYSCAKAAVHQMTRELAVEYAQDGIRVNTIAPAQTLTPGLKEHIKNKAFQEQVLPKILNGIPMRRLLKPEEMVGPTLFLASPAAAGVTGALLPVDGGNLAMNAGGGQ
ncbi:MAG: SDR family oxidoreductase [Deltaproteobacteria bacterium]|jgi:NAD(P)-dependent dehydrogenase (short-subunit alcohol dehydrogenase family)|nr:SDR family oxidoreductase [Deltaproteobacteria bacterium]MBW2502979.1 SDR family oxidoreductase [Deltaproteobacteria bacterium]MBW2519693.1 SDR family oxidoreductase [Deltaproteobacteria bacterium]